MQEHVLNCPFKKQLFTCLFCHKLFDIKDCADHLLVCKNEAVDCDRCRQSVLRGDLKEHHKSCLNGLNIRCDFLCGWEGKYADLPHHQFYGCPEVVESCAVCGEFYRKKERANHYETREEAHLEVVSKSVSASTARLNRLRADCEDCYNKNEDQKYMRECLVLRDYERLQCVFNMNLKPLY